VSQWRTRTKETTPCSRARGIRLLIAIAGAFWISYIAVGLATSYWVTAHYGATWRAKTGVTYLAMHTIPTTVALLMAAILWPTTPSTFGALGSVGGVLCALSWLARSLLTAPRMQHDAE
jgi:predicted anti-sigma-YlaC factor YlaD